MRSKLTPWLCAPASGADDDDGAAWTLSSAPEAVGRTPPAAPPGRSCCRKASPPAPVRCAPCTPPLAHISATPSPFAWASSARADGRQTPALNAVPAAAAPAAGDAAGVLGWLEAWGKLAESLGCAASNSTAPSSSLDGAASPGAGLFADASVRLR